MNFFKKIAQRVGDTAEQKIEETANNFVSRGIDQSAAKAAQMLGAQFGRPVEYKQQQVIAGYQDQSLQNEPVSIQAPAQQQGYSIPFNPFYNPYQAQPVLSFDSPAVNKLDEDKVKRLAAYKTQLFFQVNKIGKNTIRFAGQKFFGHNIEQSREIVGRFENGEIGLEKEYKKAKFKIQKLAELENMKDDAEQEKLFRDFVADVIFEELKMKNERGELEMPTMFDIALQTFGFHAWTVFSPDVSLEAYLGL